MPIRVVCDSCASSMSVAEDAVGRAVRCPKCQTMLAVPAARTTAAVRAESARPARNPGVRSAPSPSRADDEEELPRKQRPAPDADEERPRMKSHPKRGGIPFWVKAGVAGLVLAGLGVAAGVAVFVLVVGRNQTTPTIGKTGLSPATNVAGSNSTPPASGTKYVPRESEQKFQDYLKGMSDTELHNVTDDQVYAIMGEPTRKGAPITGRKNGQVFTVYSAYWETPGSGVQSQISFANGRIAGMVLGLEVTAPDRRD